MIVVALVSFIVAVLLFILFIIRRDHGSKEPTGALLAAFGFGVLALILASVLNELILPERVVSGIGTKELSGIPVTTLITASLAVGLIEESLKALPLAAYIYKKQYFNELTDGIIYFGIVGLTFGIIEDIFYSLQFGGGVGLVRILFFPYLHTCFSVLFGLTFITKKLFNKSWLLVLAGYAGAIFTHALFDFSVFKGGLYLPLVTLPLTIFLNTMLFVIFKRVQRLDEKMGRSATGINKYCRRCGKPNPQRLLYCTYCGRLS